MNPAAAILVGVVAALLLSFGAKGVSKLIITARAKQWMPKAREYAIRQGVDPAIFCALIDRESDWNKDAYREEPNYRWVGDYPNRDVATGDASYGFVQILYSVARAEAGYNDDNPKGLFDPDINLHLGAVYLKKLLDRSGGNYEDALSRYNSGRPLASAPEHTRTVYVPEILRDAPGYQVALNTLPSDTGLA